MILKIYGNIPPGEILSVRVNGETKTLDSIDTQVDFFINKETKLEIDIEREISKSNRKPLFILLFLITVVVQGIFNILLMNTSTKWYRSIKAYCIKARLIVNMEKDLTIHLTYINSKYDEICQSWDLPTLKVEPNFVSNISYIMNLCDFKNQYFNYFKRVVSIASVLILFSVLIYIAIINLNFIAIILVSVLIIGIIILVIRLLIFQYKKFITLYHNFLNQNKTIN